tara:strand:- start:132 stop:713 length:582 start_codon:yes stop_codon:yes gene_type:complete
MALLIQATKVIEHKLLSSRLIYRSFHDTRFLVDLDESHKDNVSKLLEKIKFLPTKTHPDSTIIEDSVIIKTPVDQAPYYNSTIGKTLVHQDINPYTQELKKLLKMDISEVTLRRMSSLTPFTIPPHVDDLARVGLVTTNLFNCRNAVTVAGQEFELSTDQALSFDPRLIHYSTSQPLNPLLPWHREVIIFVQK